MSKTKRIPLKHRTLENDIKYRGPISYRYIRIMAWVFLIISQIGILVKFNIKLDPASQSQIGWLKDAGSFLSSLPLPLFLLANFAFIFQRKGNWKYLLTFYGGVALVLYILGNVIIIHYGYGFINAFTPTDFMQMANAFGSLLFNLGNLGSVFNIFIDLFLCTLLFFFMNYTPKNIKKENIKYFRLLALLPILYEVASILIKYFVATGAMNIPFFCFFLLPSKPPMMFVAFVVLVLVLKIEEYKRLKEKQDPHFITEHRKTNAHSLRFSIIIAIVFFSAALLDLIIYFVSAIAIGENVFTPGIVDEETAAYFGMYVVDSMGFGRATSLFIVAPIALLFSYTKTHQNKKIDTFIPIIAIALIAFVYLEGMFQIVTIHIARVIERLKEILNGE